MQEVLNDIACIYNAWLFRQLLQGINFVYDWEYGSNDQILQRNCDTLCINPSVNFNVAFSTQLNNGRNYCSDNYILVKAIAT